MRRKIVGLFERAVLALAMSLLVLIAERQLQKAMKRREARLRPWNAPRPAPRS